MGRGMADHGDFQFADPSPFLGADGDSGHGAQVPAGRFQKVFGDFPQIRFIEGQDKRDLLFGASQRQSFLRVADADGGVDNQEHKIGFAQDFQGFGDTQLSQLADIVETTEYVTTFEGYEKTAAVRREMLKGPPWPAATGVLVSGLIRKGALIEIDMVAIGPFAKAFAGPPVKKAAAV